MLYGAAFDMYLAHPHKSSSSNLFSGLVTMLSRPPCLYWLPAKHAALILRSCTNSDSNCETHCVVQVLKGLAGLTQLYQVAIPGLEERARMLRPPATLEQRQASYFDAPGGVQLLVLLAGLTSAVWTVTMPCLQPGCGSNRDSCFVMLSTVASALANSRWAAAQHR